MSGSRRTADGGGPGRSCPTPAGGAVPTPSRITRGSVVVPATAALAAAFVQKRKRDGGGRVGRAVAWIAPVASVESQRRALPRTARRCECHLGRVSASGSAYGPDVLRTRLPSHARAPQPHARAPDCLRFRPRAERTTATSGSYRSKRRASGIVVSLAAVDSASYLVVKCVSRSPLRALAGMESLTRTCCTPAPTPSAPLSLTRQ
jgi:hypothetical protein